MKSQATRTSLFMKQHVLALVLLCLIGGAQCQDPQPMLGAISGGGKSATPSTDGPIASTLGAVSTTIDPVTPPSTTGVTTGIRWDKAFTFPMTSLNMEATEVLQGFGPGLVPLDANSADLKNLKAEFNYATNLTYPMSVTVGTLKNGTRAGVLGIGLKDLVTKLRAQGGATEFQGMVRESNLPIMVSLDELNRVPLDQFPEVLSYQIVCQGEDTFLNLLDPVKQECINKPVGVKTNLIPEFDFFKRLICLERAPTTAWTMQCKEWSMAPLSTGRNCVWNSPRNVTLMDTEEDLAKIVDSRLTVTMLANPQADETKQHEVPITMNVKMDLIEEFLHKKSKNERFGAVSPNFPFVNTFNSGRKLMQQPQPALGAISGGGNMMPSAPMEMVGVVMNKIVDTALIPHIPKQITQAEAEQAISIC